MARIHVLDAGTPTPTPERFGSSYVVEVSGQKIMVDCGPAATHKLVKAGLWPTEIDYVFFTHHHFDHDVDFPCFLLTRWDQSIGKENGLQVFGPSPTEKFTEGIMGEEGVFAHDWKARVSTPSASGCSSTAAAYSPVSRPTSWPRTSVRARSIQGPTGR